jgi:hypothetical protein
MSLNPLKSHEIPTNSQQVLPDIAKLVNGRRAKTWQHSFKVPCEAMGSMDCLEHLDDENHRENDEFY